jgi:hypothetical protein
VNDKSGLALGSPLGVQAASERVAEIGRPEQTNEVRRLARLIVDDPDYLSNLKVRAMTGILAPAMEVMLWRYAHGDPKADSNERARDIAAAEAIRETVRQRIREGKTLRSDALAQGARRELRLAPMPSILEDLLDEDDRTGT